jgi:uncharacterized protein DUF1843
MANAIPYGPAIQEAVASGDLKKMKAVAKAAEEHLHQHGNVASALEALKVEISRAEKKAYRSG